MNGHSGAVGNTETNCYEEVDGNVSNELTVQEKIESITNMLDSMISENGKKGKSQYGYLNAKGRRSLKRLQYFLNDIGELNE